MSVLLHQYFQPFYEFVGQAKGEEKATSVQIVKYITKELGLKPRNEIEEQYIRNRIMTKLFNLLKSKKSAYALRGLNHVTLGVKGGKGRSIRRRMSVFFYPENIKEINICQLNEEKKGKEYIVCAGYKREESKKVIKAISNGKNDLIENGKATAWTEDKVSTAD